MSYADARRPTIRPPSELNERTLQGSLPTEPLSPMATSPRRLPNYVLSSLIAHGIFAGAALFVASKQRPIELTAPTRPPMEIEFAAPPASEQRPAPRVEQVSPTETPPEPPQAAQPAPPRVEPQRAQLSARTIRDPQPHRTATSEHPSLNTGDPNGQSAANGAANSASAPHAQSQSAQATSEGPSNSGPRILTTNDLFNPSATSMMVAARLGGVALPTGPTAAQRAAARNESIFGPSRRCTGTPEECARQAASEPMNTALASQSRPLPAGTGAHSRQVASRAVEAFLPVRQIPNVGSIVARGQLVTPTVTRESPAGESAHNADFAARTGVDFGTGSLRIPQAPYRMVRAEIEVEQDAQGTITATRVASSSRSDVFDRAAERAIREALGEADAFRTPSRRRSRWAFEVSEAVADGRIDTILRNGADPNLGWRVAPEPSNGMRIRYRVRMVSMSLLREPESGSSTPSPGAAGNSG